MSIPSLGVCSTQVSTFLGSLLKSISRIKKRSSREEEAYNKQPLLHLKETHNQRWWVFLKRYLWSLRGFKRKTLSQNARLLESLMSTSTKLKNTQRNTTAWQPFFFITTAEFKSMRPTKKSEKQHNAPLAKLLRKERRRWLHTWVKSSPSGFVHFSTLAPKSPN